MHYRPLAGILIASLVAASPARGQGTADSPIAQANALVRDAVLFASRGDTAAALERLERATRLAPTLAEAHYRRGMLLARQAGSGLADMFKRRAAGAELEQAIRIDAGNPLYFLELGRLRLKQGFMRLDAQRLFKRALRAAQERGDPTAVAEVEAELGDIYHRRYQAVGHRRLITGDAWQFNPQEALGNPNYAREFLTERSTEIEDAGELDLRQAEEHYRTGAAVAPAHDKAAAGLLGILFDARRFEEFLEAARGFVRAAPDNSRAHLFYGLGLWRMNRGREATRAFDRALSLMTPSERGQLTHLSMIMRKADAESYERLTGAERGEFNRIYWSANDPLKLTIENEHLLEHLARVAYTDIRYGPPPVVATFPPGTNQLGEFSDPIDASDRTTLSGDPMMTGRITTVWYYPERNLRFVFYGPPGYNFARFAGEFRAYAEDARYAMPVKYDNVPVNEALDSIAIQTALFRPKADTLGTELVIFAGVPLRRMAGAVDIAEGPLETGLFVTDALERSVVETRRRETVVFHAERQFEQRTFMSFIAPGQYRYRVEALQPATRRAARGSGLLAVDAFDRPALMLSDVVLADRVAPRTDAPADRTEFFLDPNPAMRYAPGDEVHLYWEIYNLQADSAGVVRYEAEVTLRVQTLERRGFAANVVGGVLDAVGVTAKGDDQLTLRYEVSDVLGSRDRLPGWVALDLADAPNGTYILELLITDMASGQTFVRRRTFTVSEPEP